MIVKVQRQLSHPANTVFLYNQSKSFIELQKLDSNWLLRMGSEVKGYFEIEIRDGAIIVGNKLPDQGW